MTDLTKTTEEINIMREGGKLLEQSFNQLTKLVKPGLDIWELELAFLKYCHENTLIPACKNYAPYGMPPFETGLCVGINNQAVHNSPKKGIKLKNGDLLKIDTVIMHKGLYVDSAIAVGVGTISDARKTLIEISYKSLYDSIKLIKPGIKTGLISYTMHKILKSNGYDVLRDYAGHGIGKKMHEFPEIPCYGDANEGSILKEGMTICVEPLVTEGKHEIIHTTPWATRTKDNKDFVQVEHTVLVTNDGYEILTSTDKSH